VYLWTGTAVAVPLTLSGFKFSGTITETNQRISLFVNPCLYFWSVYFVASYIAGLMGVCSYIVSALTDTLISGLINYDLLSGPEADSAVIALVWQKLDRASSLLTRLFALTVLVLSNLDYDRIWQSRLHPHQYSSSVSSFLTLESEFYKSVWRVPMIYGFQWSPQAIALLIAVPCWFRSVRSS